jgi:hypothetical protein
MQVKTLDGHNQNWQLTGHYAHARLNNKSDLHISARNLLKTQFPTLQILEEVPLPIRKSDNYFLDFYIPMLKTAIEVHGEQHYKFIGFYHNSQLNFLKQQKRDREKKEWCEINSIKYIELPYNENQDEWINRIRN